MTVTLCHCSLAPVPFQLQAEMVLFDCQQGKTSGYPLPERRYLWQDLWNLYYNRIKRGKFVFAPYLQE